MTNLDARPQEQVCDARAARGPVAELHEAREVPLGGVRAMQVRRTLPQRTLPLVGAWCFLDEFGPQDVEMRVLPHPHTGLQTVTWPLSGLIRHRDSVGSDVVVRPGQLDLMTAGHGVAHSEFSLDGTGEPLHAVQLWVALPAGADEGPASFEQVTDPPVWSAPGVRATVFVGAVGEARSPAVVHTPLVGADVALEPGTAVLPLDPAFEHAVLVLRGRATVAGTELDPGPLLDLGDSRTEVELRADSPARLLLIGGTPLDQDVVMWWNFVGPDHASVARARADWEDPVRRAERFGVVDGHDGARIPAPELPNVRLRPRRRG
ncbi:pirin family protein [Cellulomonas massiliensis]|uniref:pirin family protein n=1 Tax=Cellulomonas massiliensis TaxID=1465811 RepID=UPI0002EA4DD0|nr:pirin family protein [Cellulomonas massiliensis]